MADGRKKEAQKHYQKVQHDSSDEEDEEEEDEGFTLASQFVAYVKHKNPNDQGTHITLTQIEYWMRQAGVIQVRKLTKTDIGVCYFYFKKYKLDFNDYEEFLRLLATRKGIPVEEIIAKLVNCGPPGEDVNAMTAMLVSRNIKIYAMRTEDASLMMINHKMEKIVY